MTSSVGLHDMVQGLASFSVWAVPRPLMNFLPGKPGVNDRKVVETEPTIKCTQFQRGNHCLQEGMYNLLQSVCTA